MSYSRQARPLDWFFLILLSLVATHASAQTSNGVWGDSEGNFYIMLISQAQDNAIMFETDLESAKVLTGGFDSVSNSLSLVSLDQQLRIDASIVDGNLSGSITRNGEQSALDADLLFAYVGGGNDGIWQSDLTDASYLTYLTLQVEQSILGVLLDTRFDPEGEISLEIYSGPQLDGLFTGIRLDAPTQSVRLDFSNPDAANGSYRDASSFPPAETATFTALRVF